MTSCTNKQERKKYKRISNNERYRSNKNIKSLICNVEGNSRKKSFYNEKQCYKTFSGTNTSPLIFKISLLQSINFPFANFYSILFSSLKLSRNGMVNEFVVRRFIQSRGSQVLKDVYYCGCPIGRSIGSLTLRDVRMNVQQDHFPFKGVREDVLVYVTSRMDVLEDVHRDVLNDVLSLETILKDVLKDVHLTVIVATPISQYIKSASWQ